MPASSGGSSRRSHEAATQDRARKSHLGSEKRVAGGLLMTLEEASSKLQDQFQVVQRTDFRGEITFELTLAQIEPACKFAKEQLGFNFLSDLSSVDNFGDEPRFEVVYELYSMDSNIHLRLKTRVSEDHLEVPSVVHLWATANWHEREVYDMMGIRISVESSCGKDTRTIPSGKISHSKANRVKCPTSRLPSPRLWPVGRSLLRLVRVTSKTANRAPVTLKNCKRSLQPLPSLPT